ncbi:MAG: hypothetical protein QM783_02020 [Phycisphaerales bacterium]
MTCLRSNRSLLSAAAVIALCAVLTPAALGQNGSAHGSGGSGVGGRQPSRVVRSEPAPALSDNAALGYYSFWLAVNADDAKTFAELCGSQEWGKPLPAELTAALIRQQPNIQKLLRTTRMKHCDFGRDFSEGFELMLPELAKMRGIARMLKADANRLILEGKSEEAAERYAALFDVARHCGQDRVLISSLVSIAIANHPVGDLVESHGASLLTKAGRAKVMAAIERLNGVEGFGVKRSIEGERELAINGTIARYDGPDAGRRFADTSLEMAFSNDEKSKTEAATKAIDEIRQMDGEALCAAGQRLKPYYVEAMKVWDLPDAQERLKKLNEAASAGEYGPLGVHLLPAFARCRTSEQKGLEAVNSVAEALRQADKDEEADAKKNGAPAKP